MIPIDEQIASQKHLIKNHSGHGFDIDEAILASLEELKRIREVQVPEEPKHVEFIRSSLQYAPPPTTAAVKSYRHDKELIAYIDTLRDLLKQCKHNSSATMDELGEMRERAEAAEAKLAALRLELGQITGEIPYGN